MLLFTSLLQWTTLAVIAVTALASPIIEREKADGLNALFKARGKKFWGSAADPNTLSISANVNILAAEFGAVTPEYSMKWSSVEPNKGSFNYKDSDQLVKWAQDNGKVIRGHTLLWHQALPEWVSKITSKSELTSILENHIANVAGHFSGKLYEEQWDVVNEIFNDDGTYRSSVFYNVLGEDFVKIAFNAARKADPNAKLYINDYGLDSDNKKLRALVSLVKKLNLNGKIIDGIGSQSHISYGETGNVHKALDILADAKVEVAITELDIEKGTSADYTVVVDACLQHDSCVSITTWGVSDANSWRKEVTPLLWNTEYKPKWCYDAVIALL